jgi:hypothetical protein
MTLLFLLSLSRSLAHAITSTGYHAFLLDSGDTVTFPPSTDSFLIFDTDVADSLTLSYPPDVTTTIGPTYAVVVTGAPTLTFAKNLTTAAAAFTLPRGVCGRSAQFLTGVLRVDFSGRSSDVPVCLFSPSTHFLESIRSTSPLRFLDGDRNITDTSFTTQSWYWTQIAVSEFDITITHSGDPEMRWNLCHTGPFVWMSHSGPENGIGIESSVTCRLVDFVSPGNEVQIALVIALGLIAIVGVAAPLVVQIKQVRKWIAAAKLSVPDSGTGEMYRRLNSASLD